MILVFVFVFVLNFSWNFFVLLPFAFREPYSTVVWQLSHCFVGSPCPLYRAYCRSMAIFYLRSCVSDFVVPAADDDAGGLNLRDFLLYCWNVCFYLPLI